jgi:hypothetical protein
MPLKIKRTGLDQYAPGGDARIRMLVVGGPDTGKTRMSTYWPRPIIANAEAGLSSVADRAVPYVDVSNSRDMLEFLNDMQRVCHAPWQDREFQTVVIDTLDTFQRKVKDEYLLAHPEMQSFRGFDAYGYLEAKTQMLLTRLLNLDMNIIVNVHYKDKKIREGSGEDATERQELMLQLIGDVKDSIFNDFDLVGWLGTYWAPGATADEPRVEKRGLTFKKTPDRPFLKDRLGVTPPWMEITFSPDDYYNLFARVIERLDEIPETEEVREIESLSAQQGGDVVGPLTGGALPPQDQASMPLAQLDKPSLQMKCREWAAKAKEFGRDDIAESLRFAGNTLKSELIDKLEKARPLLNEAAAARKAKAAQATSAESAEPAAQADAVESVASDATAPPAEPAEQSAAPAEPAATAPVPEPAVVEETPVAPSEPAPAEQGEPSAPEPAPAAPVAAETPVTTERVVTSAGDELVNTATGELPPLQTPQPADGGVPAALATLGAEVVSEPEAAEAPVEEPAPPAPAPQAEPPAPTPAPAAPAGGTAGGRQIPDVCRREGCDTALAGENQDYVKISFVKFRTFLCNRDFTEAKAAGKVPWPLKDAAA